MSWEQVTVEEVREALRCLYDTVALARCSLAERLLPGEAAPDLTAQAIRLRSLLLDAIELLEPTRAAASSTPTARCYQVLAMFVAQGLSAEQISRELGISERHVYRDRARAEERLTEFLRTAVPPASAVVATPASPRSSFDEELQSIVPSTTRVDVGATICAAAQIVSPLARERGTLVSTACHPGGPFGYASESLLRQTLVRMLSVAVRRNDRGAVTIGAAEEQHTIRVAVTTRFAPEPDMAALFAEAQSLAASQGLPWSVTSTPDGATEIVLALRLRERHVLLAVEDNSGAVELYRRYLAASGEWDVAEVPDPRLTFEVAKRLRPDAILLDILMPQQDGWTVLQMLRTQAETREIPVLVCSVYDESDLAYSLGASAYLKKPVSELQLAVSLAQCLHRSGSGG